MVSGESKMMSMPLGGGFFTTRGGVDGSPATKRCQTMRSSVQLSETARNRVLNEIVGMESEDKDKNPENELYLLFITAPFG
jgi:hypothetical protein